jgi:hypothetical protein
MAHQASVKRRWALLESNPPSNSRRAWLHTAAKGGGANASPPFPLSLLISKLCRGLAVTSRSVLPVVNARMALKTAAGDGAKPRSRGRQRPNGLWHSHARPLPSRVANQSNSLQPVSPWRAATERRCQSLKTSRHYEKQTARPAATGRAGKGKAKCLYPTNITIRSPLCRRQF